MTHGGKRKGAGRKLDGDAKKVPLNLKIDPYAKNHLQKLSELSGLSQAVIVEDLINSLDKVMICTRCKDTGFLFGAQNWSEAFIKKHGSPYYTANCDCENSAAKRKKYNDH